MKESAHVKARSAVLSELNRYEPNVQECNQTKAVHDIRHLAGLKEFVIIDLILNAKIESKTGYGENSLWMTKATLESQRLLELFKYATGFGNWQRFVILVFQSIQLALSLLEAVIEGLVIRGFVCRVQYRARRCQSMLSFEQIAGYHSQVTAIAHQIDRANRRDALSRGS